MKSLPLLTGLLLAGVHALGAAVIPYTNDFSGVGSNTAFSSENTDAQWAVSGGSYLNTSTNTSFAPSTASMTITNAAGMPFTMETQFTVTSLGNINENASTMGFGFFGLTSDFGGTNPTASSAYYLADFQIADSSPSSVGSLRILSLGDSAGFTTISTGLADMNPGSSTLAIEVGTTYTLRLTGSYTGSTLNLSLGLWDAAGVTQLGTSAAASDSSPLSGEYFGYRNRIGISGGTFTAAYDNFSIVPEPGAAGLLVLGGMMVLFGRRRMAAGL